MKEVEGVGSDPRGPLSESQITDVEAFRILSDPTRFAIYSALAWGGGEMTIREVAGRIGRRAGSLYRHFEALVDAGLLRVVGEIPTARRPAKVFRAAANPRFVYQRDRPEAIEALNRMVQSAARHAADGFARSTRCGKATTRGPARDTHAGVQNGWLNPLELQKLNELLTQARDLLIGGEPGPGKQLIELTFLMSPPGVPDTRVAGTGGAARNTPRPAES